MKIPQEFDTIRPWEPEDLPEVFDRLRKTMYQTSLTPT